MIINHNIPALNTHRMLTGNHNAAQKAMEKLSSGLRINRAGDDAAGLAISEKMRAQVRGLNQAMRNAQDGISLIQTAEGALQETHAILQRMRELAVQAANDTNTDSDRAELQKEVDQLAAELTRIAETTEFNTQKLLDGTFSGTFHIGANKDQNISLQIGKMDANALGVEGVLVSATLAAGNGFEIDGQEVTGNVLMKGDTVVAIEIGTGTAAEFYLVDDVEYNTATTAFAAMSGAEALQADDNGNYVFGGIAISTQSAANAAIETIQNALEQVSTERSKLGAYQNRLEHTINNLGTSAENLQAAESRIRDVDMAREVMEFTRANILSQASQAMLAQANQLPQAVLQLLG